MDDYNYYIITNSMRDIDEIFKKVSFDYEISTIIWCTKLSIREISQYQIISLSESAMVEALLCGVILEPIDRLIIINETIDPNNESILKEYGIAVNDRLKHGSENTQIMLWMY